MVELRDKLKASLEKNLKAQNHIAVSTLRLMIAALKDRDIQNRSASNEGKIDDSEIYNLFQSMVKQRQESKKIYDEAGRHDLGKREENEISIIQQFLPVQIVDDELIKIIDATIEEVGAKSIKDLGSIMRILREKYPGQLDMKKAADFGKKILNR